MSQNLRILVFGAHPDDCELKCGGSGARWADRGYSVRFVSVTDGRSGHHEVGGVEMAERRRNEAAGAAAVLGVESEVLSFHDGYLEPTLALRREILRVEREFQPDLVITHRPNDYHPDHRYTSLGVQDAAYMVAVPHVFPEFPATRKNPAIFYMSDGFMKPYPFSPDAFVAIDPVFERKVDAAHCHVSQMFEWLPYMAGELDAVPDGEVERHAWLKAKLETRDSRTAERFRETVDAVHGEATRYVEAFEWCEYGGSLSDEAFEAIFGHPPSGG